MNTVDLHEEFILSLRNKFDGRGEIVNMVADVLRIEKECAYRRLTGRVNFSVREIGVLAKVMDLSLDALLSPEGSCKWLPFYMPTPGSIKSFDDFCDSCHHWIERLAEIGGDDTDALCVYHCLPLEFYMHYPALCKFMFFKWGHYYVGTEEFENYSSWAIPQSLINIRQEMDAACHFRSIQYIWDHTLFSNLAMELENFGRMHVVGQDDKKEIQSDIINLIKTFERFLNGNFVPDHIYASDISLYVSTINMGFTARCFLSPRQSLFSIKTNFSNTPLANCDDTIRVIQEWMRLLRNHSILLSGSGRIERKLYFEKQLRLINDIWENGH